MMQHISLIKLLVKISCMELRVYYLYIIIINLFNKKLL